jgi:hypothetical protein
LAESVEVSTHAVPQQEPVYQGVVLRWHGSPWTVLVQVLNPQRPPWHVSAPLQWTPQLPQLVVSVWTSTHAELQHSFWAFVPQATPFVAP